MARHRLSLLIDLKPEQARRELLMALKRNGWSARRTAEQLGVCWNAVKEWIGRHGLRPQVEAARVEAGLPARGGRPRARRKG